jgi:DNA-directed RNA polymerase alpha subunit
MNKTINFGLSKIYEIITSDELISHLELNKDDKLILKGFWLDKKSRTNIADELNFKPNSVSRRYTRLINHIREGLKNLIFDINSYKQKVEELEQVKQEYINFHINETGIYPEFMIKDDSIEHVNMSERLHNRLSERDINKLSDLVNFTKTDLLNGRNFGENALKELIEIITKYNINFKQ